MLLGKAAYDLANEKLNSLKASFELWVDVSLGADFPDGE